MTTARDLEDAWALRRVARIMRMPRPGRKKPTVIAEAIARALDQRADRLVPMPRRRRDA